MLTAAAMVLIPVSRLAVRWIRLRVLEDALSPRGPRRTGEDRIIEAVCRAGRIVPGSTCLSRALAAKALLAWRGIASDIHLGVRGEPFGAHAWLECDGRVVLGGVQSAERFTELPRRGA